MKEKMKKFREIIKERNMLESSLEILQWDLETRAPKKNREYLSEVVGYLSLKSYNLVTDKNFIELVEELKNSEGLSLLEKKEIEYIYEDIEKMKKIPGNEYQEYSELVAKAQGIWAEAREKNDYDMFKETLKKIVEFTKKFAKYNRKNEKTLYDVVLQEYEKGMNSEKLDVFFGQLKKEIVPLIQKIKASKKIENKLINNVEIRVQKELNKLISDYVGFDRERGVIGTSAHPFTMNINKNDVRFTTKYIENNMFSSIFSTIHEAGHGIYEQQIGDELQGTVLAGGGTMGIHESQSRFYENIIGRDKRFWKNIYPKFQEKCEFLEKIGLDEFYRNINIVEPSLIRTEADELTYSLHIMVRYELEKEMINGEIDFDKLPQYWNEKMEEYLGVIPDSDANGVLQDVHWSTGGIGYFPSYALGSAYSAQIYNTMKQELDIDSILENKELYKIKQWLEEKIHKYGKSKTTEEIIKEMTGEELNPKYYIEYLRKKYMEIYEIV